MRDVLRLVEPQALPSVTADEYQQQVRPLWNKAKDAYAAAHREMHSLLTLVFERQMVNQRHVKGTRYAARQAIDEHVDVTQLLG